MLWSNIVLTALLPYVSDYSARLSLPNPQPITESQVSGCLPSMDGKVEGFILLTNGYRFWFKKGHIGHFAAPKTETYYDLQDPRLIPH
jgi:hypothetical protein